VQWNQNYAALNGSLLLTALVAVVVLLQAFVLPWFLPAAPAAS
jgi:hypothetical protein